MKLYFTTAGFLLTFFSLIAGASPTHLHEGRAYLGIYSNEVSEEKAELLGFPNEYGSYISRVIPGSSAEKAGLQPFDYVYGVDQKRTSRRDDLTDLLEHYEPGDEVRIHYIRDGKTNTTPVVLGKRSDWEWSRRNSESPFLGISPENDEEDEFGVPVEIIRNSTAEELGLEDGDIITAINGYPMIDWTDITTAISNMTVGETIEVAYERNGQTGRVSGTIQARRHTEKASTYSQSSERAFLGIQSSSISREKAELLGFDNPFGSYVTKVLRGTGAEKGGIQPFDYIYGIDEYRTGDNQSLTQILRKYEPGEEVEVQLIRSSAKKRLPVTLGRSSDAIREERSRCEEPFFGIRHSHEYSPKRGVAVTIVDNSTAESLALQDGDVITRINGFPIIEWQDVSIAINNMEVGETIRVNYERDGRELEGSQPIKSRCETNGSSSWTPNLNLNLNLNRNKDKNDMPRPDISRMKVDISAMPADEAKEMEEKYDIDLPTGNTLRMEGLNLFPNPSTGMFKLEFNLPQQGRTVIRIFNAAGRQIYNYDLGNFSGAFSDEVDISQNGPGSYFLLVRQGGQSLSRKIIVSGE